MLKSIFAFAKILILSYKISIFAFTKIVLGAKILRDDCALKIFIFSYKPGLLHIKLNLLKSILEEIFFLQSLNAVNASFFMTHNLPQRGEVSRCLKSLFDATFELLNKWCTKVYIMKKYRSDQKKNVSFKKDNGSELL